MRKIFKYPLHGDTLPSLCKIMLPEDFKLLHLNQQDNVIYIWADVDPTRMLKPVTFEVFATGEDLKPANALREYLGSVHLFNGNEVYHVYRRRE